MTEADESWVIRDRCRGSYLPVDVRFAPKATEVSCRREITRWANRRIAALFDHLVGEHEQVMRNGEAECIGGLEVDNEIEFGRLLDRDIARLCPA